jgi:prepilin-type processing-associated H-X9-DG protein
MIGEDVQARNVWLSWPYANNVHGTCAIPLNAVRPSGGEYAADDWANTSGFRSRHSNGANFALTDGSVRFVPNGISLDIYRGAATINGRELAPLP